MPWWIWLIIAIAAGVCGFFITYGTWHYCTYRCSIFNSKIVTTYDDSWSKKHFKSFNETYERHCQWLSNSFTKDIPFSTFKSLYAVNPDKWLFKKSLSWNDSNYFHLEYITDKEHPSWMSPPTIRVIFNKEDFRQFLWFLVEQIEEKKNTDKHATDKHSRDKAQEIINSALKDIRKLEEQAEAERKQVEETAAAVKNNIHAKINEETVKINYSYWEDKVP